MRSVFFKSARVTWQRRKRESNSEQQRPPPVKHLRWQFAFPGGQTLPGRRRQKESLACRCSQRLGLFPPWRGMLRLEGEGPEKGYCGYCKHIHAHTLRLGPPARRLRQPPNLFFTPRLAVCGHPLSQLGAWTPGIPQAGVTQRSPGDQGPSGSLNPDRRREAIPISLISWPETLMQKRHNTHKRASHLDSHTHKHSPNKLDGFECM